MIANIGRKPDAYRSIRSLFIIGLVGLILAACGVTWLLVEYAQVQALLAQKEAQTEALLAQMTAQTAQTEALFAARAAMYRGSWVEKQDLSFAISKIEINSNGLNMTIHVAGNCHAFSNLPCDMGTFTQTFTGEEPLTTRLAFTESNGTPDNWPLAINLSTDNTKLQVLVNTDNGLFDKT